MADAEKRQHHRSLALLEVRVLPGDRVPADLKLVTIDIGTGGARCASNRPLAPDAPLQLTLTLVRCELRQPAMVDDGGKVLRCTVTAAALEHRRHEIALELSHL